MRNIITASALGLILAAPGLANAATTDQDRAEIEELKRQVAMVPMLLARIEQLEKANASTQAQAPAVPAVAALETRVAAIEESNDKQSDQLAQGMASEWARNIKWKGDLRYRQELFDVQGVTSNRDRQRIRARLGMEARISSTLLAGFQIASGDAIDPRSTNATLTDANQRKSIGLDLAYVDWKPRDNLLFTVGKQKQPWFKAGGSTLFFDNDINPEGVAFQYGGKTGPFAKAWGYWLAERSTAADSNVIGAQFGYVFGGGFTVAAGYWDYSAIQDKPIPIFTASPAGNSTYTANVDCSIPSPAGAVRCYTFDYNIAEADLQWSGMVGGKPLTLFGGYLENMDPSTLNTGYQLGFLLGKAADPNTWEFGVTYEDMERDAQFAAFVDSDFADGLTQGRGYVVQGAWAPVKNMNLKASYFLNDRNYGTATEADYKRLQLDLNYKF